MFEAPSEEQLADFKAKYGPDMRVVEMEDMVFVLALPEDDKRLAEDYKRFIDNYEAGKKKEAISALFPSYCVYPDKETCDRVLKRRPGFKMSVGAFAAELFGVQAGSVKKL